MMVQFTKKRGLGDLLKAYQLLIERCMSEKRWDCAETFLHKALVHEPENVNLLLKLAEVEEKLLHTERAVLTYQKVMALTSRQIHDPQFQKASRRLDRIASPDCLPQLSD